MKTKLLLNNRAIHNHKSNFMGVNGKEFLRVYTSFKMTTTTQLL